jgi:hypothetical protein
MITPEDYRKLYPDWDGGGALIILLALSILVAFFAVQFVYIRFIEPPLGRLFQRLKERIIKFRYIKNIIAFGNKRLADFL